MADIQKKSGNPEVEAKIVTVPGVRSNWFVKKLDLKPNTKVTWRSGINSFIVWFPKDHNPVASGKTEIYGKNGKASAEMGSKAGTYTYCILVTDEAGEVHLVEGNSPPTMVIE